VDLAPLHAKIGQLTLGLCNPFSVNFRGGGHDDRVTG
jgi:hypothetical protein